jgi:DNA-binding response OmpR family regulator
MPYISPFQQAFSQNVSSREKSSTSATVFAGRESITTPRQRIGILEDDPCQAEFICSSLVEAGYDCQSFSKSQTLLHRLQTIRFDLLILDWQLPDATGEFALRHIRERMSLTTPVLFLTSCSSDEARIFMLRAGANDYLVKPVAGRQLRARAQTLLESRSDASATFRLCEAHGEYTFYRPSKQISARGVPIPVNATEFRLALLLFRNAGKSLSFRRLADAIGEEEVNPEIISRHIAKTRTKLRLFSINGYRISPIYNYGYRLDVIDRNEIINTPLHCTQM